jgi:hypothetical protein
MLASSYAPSDSPSRARKETSTLAVWVYVAPSTLTAHPNGMLEPPARYWGASKGYDTPLLPGREQMRAFRRATASAHSPTLCTGR